METVHCDLCGGDEFELFLEERDLLQGIAGIFHLVRCKNCGLMYLNPRPNFLQMSRYYPSGYAPYRRLIDHSSWLVRWDFLYGQRRNYRALLKHVNSRSGKLLDIGCAVGGFLAAMRKWGDWETYGVEIDRESVRYAQTKLNLNVFAGTLHEANYPDNFFDIVTLWNVIEHLHHPQATLEEIARIIRPGGVIAVSTPNPDSLEAKFFGSHWAGWDAPRHLYIYSPEVLKRALKLAGFEFNSMSSYSGGCSVLSLTLRHVIRNRIRSQKLRKMLIGIIDSFLLRVIIWPYYYVAGRLNISSVMTIFANRREEL